MRLRLQIRFLYAAFLTLAVAYGQASTSAEVPIKVVTVCDILLVGTEFDGKTVAVLGRYVSSDEGQWLVEDDCGIKVGVNGTTQAASVWLVPRNSPLLAIPRMPVLDQDSLKAKLVQAGKTTKLGKRLQYQCQVSMNEGKIGKTECGWPELPDRWAIAYGTVEAMANPGFGHLGGSRAQVFTQGVLVFIDENGRLRR